MVCALFVLAFVLPCGCSTFWLGRTGGRLHIESQLDQGTILSGGFETGLYRFDGPNEVTVLLFDGPPEAPSQAMAIRMLWQPRAGRTPIDPSATNATVHYVIMSDTGQMGVYGGAGYLFTHSTPGSATFSAGLWQANLSLSDQSEGFSDLLGQAIIQGSFTARRDDMATTQALRRLHQLVQQNLGYPRMVRAPASVDLLSSDATQ